MILTSLEQLKAIDKTMYEFNKEKHIHTLDGKALTGVTTVLGVVSKGDGLIQWSANEACKCIESKIADPRDEFYGSDIIKWLEEAKIAWKTSRDTAGEKGTDLHAVVEMMIGYAINESNGIINGKWDRVIEILVETPEKKQQLKHFLEWAKDKKFLESEKHIYSKELWIGGIVDFVYEFNGEVYIGDIKTAKAIYPTNFWQTSAYQFCLQEMGMYPKIKGFTIVRLGKDGTFETQDNYAYEDNISGFMSALNIYRKLNAITVPKKVKSNYRSIKKVTTK